MALVDSTWYVNFGDGSTTGHYAVAKRAASTAVAAGVIRRQFTAPAVGSERCFVCIVAGTTSGSTDATWTLTRGAKSTDNTVTWQECSGQAALNGDLTNTATWAQVKAATPAVLGQIIKRSNNASYQICTTAGAMSASEPAFSDTAGVTTTDTTAVWTSLGAVSNFTGGQAPHARLSNNVFTANWFASGNTVYVGDNHAETQSTGFNIAGSSALMAKILCHDHAGSYPPAALTTGASITTTGSSNLSITLQGSFYFYGITFSGATTGNSTSYLSVNPTAVGQVHNWYYFDHCSFQIGTTGSGVWIALGGGASGLHNVIVFDNTTVKFGAVSHYMMVLFTQFIWRNTGQVLAGGSAVPATLLQQTVAAGQLNNVVFEALDLSQLTGSVFSNSASSIGSLTVNDCKLNASTTVTTPINTGMTVQLARAASGATPYVSSRYTYEAVETTETSIVRTSGFADPQGQQQSRKIVTTANTQWLRPYAAQPLAVWNAATGSSKTVTVYGTINSASLPNNDDIWLEVSGLTNASFPVGSTVTSGKANVWSANSAGSSDGSAWGGGGSGAGWSPFKLVATLTPNMAGYLIPQVKVAKASSTFYIDPLAVVT